MQKFFQYFDYYRVIHSVKTAIACLIGLAIAQYLGWPIGAQWIPITTIVVMSAQVRFGGALQKAYMRFLGTVAGVITTLLTLALFDHITAVIFFVVFVACLFFTYIASSEESISYAGTLGGVTVILTLTGSPANYQYALQRGFYIVIGIVIALLVSRFIFPLHARTRLSRSVSEVLRKLQRLYFITVQGGAKEWAEFIDKNLDQELNQLIAGQLQLIGEASIGSRYFSRYKKDLFKEAYNIERRMYRLINLMDRSLRESGGEFVYIMHKIGSIEELHTEIETSLGNLADSFSGSLKVDDGPNFVEVPTKLASILEKFPDEHDVQKMISEHSFMFFMRQMIQEIEKMQQIAKQIGLLKNE